MMYTLGIIPARMASTRFPNKPMAKIMGIPMIEHCYIRSKMCKLLDDVYVATCDKEIFDYIEGIGGKAIMTADTHERASERSAEALLNIEKELNGRKFDLVVMIQGDEPLIYPNMISEAILPLIGGDKMVSNLMTPLITEEDRIDPNNVKVVTDINGNALYMSREPIPSKKKYKGNIKAYRQLGLIAFTREALLKFISLQTTPLEIIESVDMNRFLEHGVPIQMIVSKFEASSVDTVEDLKVVEAKMYDDPLFQSYKTK